MEVPVSAIEALEMSLGREHKFSKYYGLTVAASSIVGGTIGLTRGNACTGCGDFAGGILVGYLVVIPLGALVGSLRTEERWNPVAISGRAESGPTIRRVIGNEVGLAAGQKVRVRAAGVLSVEGVFEAFEGHNMLLSTTQAGPEQRIPIDRVQAVWVQKRATRKGAVIGAITGGVFFTGAMFYLTEYILDEPGEGLRFPAVAFGGAVGAGLGAAVGTLIGYWLPEWSPSGRELRDRRRQRGG